MLRLTRMQNGSSRLASAMARIVLELGNVDSKQFPNNSFHIRGIKLYEASHTEASTHRSS